MVSLLVFNCPRNLSTWSCCGKPGIQHRSSCCKGNWRFCSSCAEFWCWSIIRHRQNKPASWCVLTKIGKIMKYCFLSLRFSVLFLVPSQKHRLEAPCRADGNSKNFTFQVRSFLAFLFPLFLEDCLFSQIFRTYFQPILRIVRMPISKPQWHFQGR